MESDKNVFFEDDGSDIESNCNEFFVKKKIVIDKSVYLIKDLYEINNEIEFNFQD